MNDRIAKNLKKNLPSEVRRVVLEKGTEPPGSGMYLHDKRKGSYRCIVCGAVLFLSKDKYDSITPGLSGWPSFINSSSPESVKLAQDNSYGMHRTEVQCRKCGAHLGHLFEDVSMPNGKHYCINSVSLDFESQEDDNKNKTL